MIYRASPGSSTQYLTSSLLMKLFNVYLLNLTQNYCRLGSRRSDRFGTNLQFIESRRKKRRSCMCYLLKSNSELLGGICRRTEKMNHHFVNVCILKMNLELLPSSVLKAWALENQIVKWGRAHCRHQVFSNFYPPPPFHHYSSSGQNPPNSKCQR